MGARRAGEGKNEVKADCDSVEALLFKRPTAVRKGDWDNHQNANCSGEGSDLYGV